MIVVQIRLGNGEKHFIYHGFKPAVDGGPDSDLIEKEVAWLKAEKNSEIMFDNEGNPLIYDKDIGLISLLNKQVMFEFRIGGDGKHLLNR